MAEASVSRGRIWSVLAARPGLRLSLTLIPPLAWLVIAYLGSLVVLLVSAWWTVDSFSGSVVHTVTTENFRSILGDPLFRTVTVRTIAVALGVTLVDAVIAVPLALYMAKIASSRAQVLLLVAVTTPLWASYLVKAYAWRGLLAPDGPVDWVTAGHSPSYGLTATVWTLAYLWFPYMVLPAFASLQKLPDSLLEAGADLGASSLTTLRRVALPLVFPGIAAGSIFTFSLSMGDYIAVTIVGGKTQLLGNLIYGQLVTANNQPLAAALSLIPIAAVLVYLVVLRATGALEED
jgi:putative spermidine/putrescine transport system permease protein